MARIIYPADFTGSKTLTDNINARHDADGAASELIPFMQEQQFNIADDVAALKKAEINHKSGALLTRQAENYRELRDNSFLTPFANMQAGVQFLKKLFRNNVQALGDWGITVNSSARIDYPTGFEARTTIFESYATKHNSYGGNKSPLQPFIDTNGIDMAADATATAQALEHHTSMLKAQRDAEEQTNLRNNGWLPTQEHNRGIGQYLVKLYVNNPKKLGDWGFVVDDSPRAPKLRKSVIKPLEKMELTAVTIGSTLTNIGETDLHVYAGKSTSGIPSIVKPGETLGMTKGYSTTTVVNPSSLKKGMLSTLGSK